ncbi:hypothetical protein FHS91_003129, partial [Sphingobium xanthum]|uniref:hypothetical protein n=1 Tax=Sphingobium xanthum TaxID=1387165 RepID=UPI003D1C9333
MLLHILASAAAIIVEANPALSARSHFRQAGMEFGELVGAQFVLLSVVEGVQPEIHGPMTCNIFAVTEWVGEPSMVCDEHSELRWFTRDCQIFCARGRLSSSDDEPLAEDHGELGFCLGPLARWPFPFIGG